MFTGIVEEVGTIGAMLRGTNSVRLTIGHSTHLNDIKIGDSVAVNGICLTATSVSSLAFTADVMHETLARSALANLQVGNKVNLERALLATSRLGGHIVAGHVDGLGKITAITQDDIAFWYRISAPANIMRYIIEKGSIAIDGISLTVASVSETDFSVSIIPHTRAQTSLALRKIGDLVNLENDLVGKYIERFMFFDKKENADGPVQSKIDRNFLQEHGFVG